MFGVEVIFNQRGYWSKRYTFESNEAYQEGDIVVTPTGDFYSVGKVKACYPNYKFNPKVAYKTITCKVKELCYASPDRPQTTEQGSNKPQGKTIKIMQS
jgi:hypothetical protein